MALACSRGARVLPCGRQPCVEGSGGVARPSLWIESMSGQSFASHWRQKPNDGGATRPSVDAWQCGQRDHHSALRVCERELTSRSCSHGGSVAALASRGAIDAWSALTSATTAASAAERAAPGGTSPHAAC